MKRPEQEFQIALMEWLDLVLPMDAVAFAIPNAARRGLVEGRMMKRMGTKAGMPDICIVWQGRAIFLECKAPKGRASKPQIDMGLKLKMAGAHVRIVRSVEDTQEALDLFAIPTRRVRLDGRMDRGTRS